MNDRDMTREQLIEELQAARERLAEQEQRYRLLMDRNLGGVYRSTLDGRFLDCNEALARILGCASREEVLSHSAQDFYFQPAEREQFVALLRQRGSLTNFERRLRRKDGSTVHGLENAVLDEGPEGTILQGTLIDISDRWQTRQELMQERHLLHSLMDHLPDPIYFKDTASRFVRVNRALGAMFSLADPAQAIGRTDADYFTEEHARQAYLDEQEVMRTGQPMIRKEEKETWPDGHVTWALSSKLPLRDAEGRIIGTFGISRDITQRRQAEEALARERAFLRSLIDSVPDLIFSKDLHGVHLLCNPAFEKFAGRSEAEIVGRTDFDLFPREKAEFFRARDQEMVTAGQARSNEEWIEYPDGRRVLVEVLKMPFYGPDGEIVGLIGMSRDITERKRLEEQLRQAQKMEAIGQLAGGVAHDFNNLLTAILGNISLLLASLPEDESNRELLRETEKAALRAAELTGQLLGFSRQTLLRLRPTQLNAVVGEMADILRRTIDPRIRIEVQAAPGLWPVRADAGQMNQVLMNLCLNARDAMPQGGALMLETANVVLEPEQVRGHLDARAGEFVRLRVRDTGHGIPPHVRPRIFDPFFTTKELGKGTGLGLSMVFGIVKQHQGWVECASVVNQGTAFDIYVPRSRDSAEEKAMGTSDTKFPGGSIGHETILLVDDEAIIRNLGRTILQRFGYQVLLAEDGLQAVELYSRERQRIDLVILDLTMPRLSGRDTLRQLLQIDPQVRVLFSSGYSSEQMTDADKKGVLGFVNKPYRPQDLAQTVRAVLDQGKQPKS